MFWVVLTAALSAERQRGLLIVLMRHEPLQFATVKGLPMRAVGRDQFSVRLTRALEVQIMGCFQIEETQIPGANKIL